MSIILLRENRFLEQSRGTLMQLAILDRQILRNSQQINFMMLKLLKTLHAKITSKRLRIMKIRLENYTIISKTTPPSTKSPFNISFNSVNRRTETQKRSIY